MNLLAIFNFSMLCAKGTRKIWRAQILNYEFFIHTFSSSPYSSTPLSSHPFPPTLFLLLYYSIADMRHRSEKVECSLDHKIQPFKICFDFRILDFCILITKFNLFQFKKFIQSKNFIFLWQWSELGSKIFLINLLEFLNLWFRKTEVEC